MQTQLRVKSHVLPHARLSCACQAIKSYIFGVRVHQKCLRLCTCALSLKISLSALLLKGLRHQISCSAWKSQNTDRLYMLSYAIGLRTRAPHSQFLSGTPSCGSMCWLTATALLKDPLSLDFQQGNCCRFSHTCPTKKEVSALLRSSRKINSRWP